VRPERSLAARARHSTAKGVRHNAHGPPRKAAAPPYARRAGAEQVNTGTSRKLAHLGKESASTPAHERGSSEFNRRSIYICNRLNIYAAGYMYIYIYRERERERQRQRERETEREREREREGDIYIYV
jgi:hypothetical protein